MCDDCAPGFTALNDQLTAALKELTDNLTDDARHVLTLMAVEHMLENGPEDSVRSIGQHLASLGFDPTSREDMDRGMKVAGECGHLVETVLAYAREARVRGWV